MSIRNLDKLFNPKSVAVIGASNRPRSVGATVMHNLLSGGFSGAIMPVNPKYSAVLGVLAYKEIANLPIVPDLAVICTPAGTVPAIVDALGRMGTRAAIVLSAGLREERDASGVTLSLQMLRAARPHMMRIVGPNCIGMLSSVARINASFAPSAPLGGDLAFITQSGAIATMVLDWASARDIGFSHFLSIGDAADVDAGDLLDYLASDAHTSAILLYLEAVTSARKFMSAARAAARNKPVIIIKAGRADEGAEAAASHTGALAGADEVYEAAIRRSGMLRVYTIQDLFNAAETLGRARPKRGDPLTILTNGGGAGVIASDALAACSGKLSTLTEQTVASLDAVLPRTWSRRNPIDIIGDASAERYVVALTAVLRDPTPQTVLLIHAPTALIPAESIAEAVAPAIRGARHTVLTCWPGGRSASLARATCAAAEIPTFDMPEAAVAAHLQTVAYRRNQEALMEVPPSIAQEFTPDIGAAREIIDAALASGKEMVSEPMAKALLSAYDIPVVETRIADNAAHARQLAIELGFPVALKVLSPDITHKTDVGGVALDLEDSAAVADAAAAMRRRVSELRPNAEFQGFSVQPMIRRTGAFELIVGAREDPVFGPVIMFGEGGTAVEVVADRAISLPPLNMVLAMDMIDRTRIAARLDGYRDRSPTDRGAIALSLIKVSQLMTDLPEIVELDINPLIADAAGVLALDARIRLQRAGTDGHDRLCIRPYPKELEETLIFSGRQIMLRPIRPEDERQHHELLSRLAPNDVRFRFFSTIRDLPHSQMARYTQIDYEREMAFIATGTDNEGKSETLGVVRAITDPDNESAEFAIVVRSDVKGHGLGSALLDKIIAYCRNRGTDELIGQIMAENRAMLGLAKSRGFEHRQSASTDIVDISLKL